MRPLFLAPLLLAVSAAADDISDAQSRLREAFRDRPLANAGLRPADLVPPAAEALRVPLRSGPARTVSGTATTVTLQVDASADAAIDALHRERAAFYRETGADMQQLENESRRRGDARDTVYLSLHRPTAEIVGILKATGSAYQPWQIWSLELGGDARARRVVVSAGQLGARQGVCVRYYDSRGLEFSRQFIGATSLENDPAPSFRSSCRG